MNRVKHIQSLFIYQDGDMNDLDLDKALEEAVKSFPPAFMLPHEEDYYRLGFMDAWNLCHKKTLRRDINELYTGS